MIDSFADPIAIVMTSILIGYSFAFLIIPQIYTLRKDKFFHSWDNRE
jgi:multisubunit Na+/H+ antiporter MnhC subunit